MGPGRTHYESFVILLYSPPFVVYKLSGELFLPLGSPACMNLDRSLCLSHTNIMPHSLYQYFLNDCLYYKCLLLLEDSPARGIIMPILYLVQIQFMNIRLYHEEKEAKVCRLYFIHSRFSFVSLSTSNG